MVVTNSQNPSPTAQAGLEGSTELFDSGSKAAAPMVDVKAPHGKIGELTFELEFLEVALGIAGCPAQSD
jgi:hypothetical protein